MSQTVVTVSNAAQFNAAVKAAATVGAGPETILLAPGVYDGLQIYNQTIASSLTIESANVAHPAVLEDFRLQETNNVTVQNVEFSNAQLANASTDSEAELFDDANITINNAVFTGNPSDTTVAVAGKGVYINGGSNITVNSSVFEYLHDGINQENANGITISDNTFRWIFDDGIDGGNSDNVSVLGNYFTDMHFDPTDSDHPDCIQFWTSNDTATTDNITVEYNTYVRGQGAAIQGIFITSQNAYTYDNVTVEHNSIVGAEYNGIWIDSAADIDVENNVVQPYNDVISRLILSSDSSGIVQNNEAGTQFDVLADVSVTASNNPTLAAIPIPSVGSFVSAMAATTTAGSISPTTTTQQTSEAHPLGSFLTVSTRI